MLDHLYVPRSSSEFTYTSEVWEDFFSMALLADTEEEYGNDKASTAIRWIISHKRIPMPSLLKGKDGYWWLYEFNYASPNVDLKYEIPKHLMGRIHQLYRVFDYVVPPESATPAGFPSVEDAYLALVSVLIHNAD